MAAAEFNDLAPLLRQLSSLSSPVILGAAAFHLFLFFVLTLWYRRDLSVITGCLDEFTRGLRHRSVLGRNADLTSQIDAFVEDINDVISDPTRTEERSECLRRMHILDERRSYLDSLSFETAGNMMRTMIEAYPLAGVLGTILAIGSALHTPGESAEPAATMAAIVGRFGDAIWSTFCGLSAAIVLMFVNSLLETRFDRLTQARSHVRDMVAGAKRELALSAERDRDRNRPELTETTAAAPGARRS
ncbi:MAG: MotA/TolQ/ExbB proton channel family protein [Planctomycetaceae bacterium]